jgi:SAM-dependent methyltransferase
VTPNDPTMENCNWLAKVAWLILLLVGGLAFFWLVVLRIVAKLHGGDLPTPSTFRSEGDDVRPCCAIKDQSLMNKWLKTFFDVTARKPSGWLGKLMYRKPVGHYGFFRVAVEELQLQPENIFLEVGCGGGILLDMVLQTVQRACGIDHSSDMIELARQKNAQALFEGRVEIVQGDVQALPWDENHFTCAAGVEMLYFIEDPMQTLRKLYRVLKPGGRLVFVTGAQPKSALSKLLSAPWLRHLRFHSDDELASMLRGAGFQIAQVQRTDRSEHTSFAHQLAYAVK